VTTRELLAILAAGGHAVRLGDDGRVMVKPGPAGELFEAVRRNRDKIALLLSGVEPAEDWTDGDRWFVGEWPGVEWPERPETFGRVYCRMER
jgi:hypothetical protein